MGLIYRLEDYARYQQAVGAATYVDATRRTDPARAPFVWERLGELAATYGAPWVVQVWTKDPAGVARHGGALLRTLRQAGSTLALQLTVTGLAGSIWEPLVPPGGLEGAAELLELLGGPAHVTWRYDPIIPKVHTPERFAGLARRAAALGLRRSVINFLAPPGRYARVDRRLAPLLPGWTDGMPGYDEAWRLAVAREVVEIACAEGLEVGCCAESAALAGEVSGLRRAACGDHGWFVSLAGSSPPPTRGASRSGCGCARYFDVGSYGQWARCHRCLYCYAG